MSYPLTDGLIDTLRYGSYLIASRLTIFRRGKRLTTVVLPTSKVQITMDRNSTYRSEGTITLEIIPTVPPPAYLPITPKGILAPFGNEVFVETKIESVTAAVSKYVPLGLFTIATTTVNDTGVDLSVTLKVYTRAWLISQRLFRTAYTVPAATGTLAGELQHLLSTAWNTTNSPLTFSGISKTGAQLKVPGQSFTQGNSPWTAALQMALSVGYEVWITTSTIVRPTTTEPPASIKPIVMARRVPTGYLGKITVTGTIKTIVTWEPTKSMGNPKPVWFFTTTATLVYGSGTGSGSSALYGDQYTTPVGTQVQLTTTGVYNEVVITGASQTTATGATTVTGTASVNTEPVIAVAATATPTQEMSINTSAIGVRPEFVTTSYITTTTGARQAAVSQLAQSLSDAWQITITTAPNPAIRIDDVISVTRPRLGLRTATVIVDTITHLISFATLMTITGRVIRNTTTKWKPSKGYA
jgi:hypothetical protein